jgi:tRNA 2-thiouridine synthesizing protein D
MHFVISSTYGATDPTRASLPFIFAASALQAGDSVLIMLFHDAVTVAVKGAHEKIIPVGPPSRFAEVLAHAQARVLVCKPCAEVRGIGTDLLVANTAMGGMNEFHAEASRPDARLVAF